MSEEQGAASEAMADAVGDLDQAWEGFKESILGSTTALDNMTAAASAGATVLNQSRRVLTGDQSARHADFRGMDRARARNWTRLMELVGFMARREEGAVLR